MPMLRTTFKTPAKSRGARPAVVTVRGIYEIFLNGKGEQRIGRIEE